MNDRSAARTVGILFIVASVAGVISGLVYQPVVDAQDYLTAAANDQARVATGALFEIAMYAAIVGIAIVLYPLLTRFSERLALGYVVARTIEVLTFIVGSAVVSLTLSSLGSSFVDAGRPDASSFQTSGDALVASRDWATAALAVIAFAISALILNGLLWRTELVPRWLSGWGLAGAVLYLFTGVLVLYGLEAFSAPQTLLQAPLALQEMVFAVWLIAKGFSSSAPVDEVAPSREPVGVG